MGITLTKAILGALVKICMVLVISCCSQFKSISHYSKLVIRNAICISLRLSDYYSWYKCISSQKINYARVIMKQKTVKGVCMASL